MFEVAIQTEAFESHGQDRVDAIAHPHGIVLVVADGAGGTSGGAEAADAVLLATRSYVTHAADIRDAMQWEQMLAAIDRQISISGNGQTTAVILAVSEGGLSGASVGDSAAWLIDEQDGYRDLTAGQIRKPLLGSGASQPVAFEHAWKGGTLLVATDGLVKYAPPARICEVARGPDLPTAARHLIDLVRLRTGALQDDVGVALCRMPNR
ncbi:MAG TPA: protein phosphatase 2C domain-containing protein [Tepidisphaeraceae bacterium]